MYTFDAKEDSHQVVLVKIAQRFLRLCANVVVRFGAAVYAVFVSTYVLEVFSVSCAGSMLLLYQRGFLL